MIFSPIPFVGAWDTIRRLTKRKREKEKCIGIFVPKNMTKLETREITFIDGRKMEIKVRVLKETNQE